MPCGGAYAMIRRVGHDRVALNTILTQRVEQGANRVVQPREAGNKQPRQAALLKIWLIV